MSPTAETEALRSPGCSVVGFLLRIFAVCQKMRSFVHHSVAESCIHSPTSDNMDRLTMSRTSVVLVSLLIAASIVAAQTPPASESSARSEAIRRYQNLLNNNSPAISTSRDEILFRLGLLYLEDAQAAGPGVGSYGNRDRYEQALSLFQQVLARPGSIFREDALYYQAIAFEETGR